jgi:hypothetical protein
MAENQSSGASPLAIKSVAIPTSADLYRLAVGPAQLPRKRPCVSKALSSAVSLAQQAGGYLETGRASTTDPAIN